MQPLARDGFNDGQVSAMLTTADPELQFGAELVNPDLALREDISDDVEDLTVSRDMSADVHGSISMKINRELRWGIDRVRPYLLLRTARGVTRWNMGVYTLDAPDEPGGTTPATFDATGGDTLGLLQRLVGDSYTIPSGTNVIEAVTQAVTDSGIGSPLRIDSDKADATLPKSMSWPLFPIRGASGGDAASWMMITSELLGVIGYEPLWADWDGALRSRRNRAAADRPAEWVFNIDDPVSGIIEPEYTRASDVWGAPNRWFFYSRGLLGAPIEGTTLYVRDNIDVGPSSQLAAGIIPAAPMALEAYDYESLKEHGDQIADKQMHGTVTIHAKTGAFPLLWHNDVAEWNHHGNSKVRGLRWQISSPFAHTDMEWEVAE